MPVVANDQAHEVPWRPGYRVFALAGREQGVACGSSRAVIEPGAGAPLHVHADVDEVIIVVEGTLDVRLGEERRLVGPDHTISIPAGTPHGFVAVGQVPARTYTFFPKLGAFAATTYLEGGPPAGAARR
jgi:mannose-6-phosphate isomerase-like protein (cupin superfamily)